MRTEKGILSELTSTVSGLNVDIVKADVSEDKIGQGDAKFEVAVENITQLEKLIESLKNLGGVISVERLTETSHPRPDDLN